MDGFLIVFYRITGYSLVDYFIGTMVLSFICVIIGELSVSLAIRFNKRYLDSMSREMQEKEKLSMEAYRVGDKESYKSLNKEASMISQFRDLVGSQGEYIEYINLGHFHNAGTLDSVRGEVILNGSFKGGDEYSLGKMNTISEPKQQLYLIHPKRGKSWQCGINFRFAPDYVDPDNLRYHYEKNVQFAEQLKEF